MTRKSQPAENRSELVAQVSGRLRGQSRRLTGARQAVLRVLADAGRPLSSKEIHEALPGGFCDVVTVYRSLHLLEGLGAVQRFDLGDGVARYRILTEGDDGHHHHLVCRHCWTVVEMDQCILGELQARLARDTGFCALTHRLQFFGTCPACQRHRPGRLPASVA